MAVLFGISNQMLAAIGAHPGDGRPVQDEARALRLDHDAAGRLAPDLHVLTAGLEKIFPPRSEDRFHVPCVHLPIGPERWESACAGQVDGRDEPDCYKRLRRYGALRAVRSGGGQHGRVRHPLSHDGVALRSSIGRRSRPSPRPWSPARSDVRQARAGSASNSGS